jgi:hypothetical protein
VTVQELIDKLQKVEDKSIEVVTWDPYHDRSTTEVNACVLRNGRVLISNAEIGTAL